MAPNKDRYTCIERLIYVALWGFAALLPILLQLWEYLNVSVFDWRPIFKWWTGMIPLIIIFLFHNQLLIPKVMKKGKMASYGIYAIGILVLYAGVLYVTSNAPSNVHGEGFHHHTFVPAPNSYPDLPPPPPELLDRVPHQRPPHTFPIPVLFNIVLAIMTMGINAAVSLLIGYNREREKRKDLDNVRLQEELKYLRQQISPHFFMNVLNNIHEMAEEDVGTAQDMILELAQLMRYVLYESESDTTTLNAESKFIRSYVALMRRRYLEDVVRVNLELPENASDDVHIPPLLFISFIENAFKHGVSYLSETQIDIRLCEVDGRVFFNCDNTLVQKDEEREDKGGLGLANVHRRLSLLYGNDYSLSLEDNGSRYSVKLIIPSL